MNIIENKKMDDIYFKFFPKSLILRGFQYKLGLNEDDKPFNPEPICSEGGLYYTDINHLDKFKSYGEIIGIITIPSDVPIVKVGDDKYKSPKIFVKEFIEYKKFLQDKALYFEEKKKCKNLCMCYEFAVTPSAEICLKAVKQNGNALKYVIEQTPEICLEAIKQNGDALHYVKEQTPEICLEAVKQNSNALIYVKEQTPEICLEAVKQSLISIKYITTEYLIRETIKRLDL